VRSFSAHSYNMEYLEDIFFDNKYITGYFYRIDERRQKLVSYLSLCCDRILTWYSILAALIDRITGLAWSTGLLYVRLCSISVLNWTKSLAVVRVGRPYRLYPKQARLYRSMAPWHVPRAPRFKGDPRYGNKRCIRTSWLVLLSLGSGHFG